MVFTETVLKGAFILEIKQLEDERGFFARTWCKQEIEDHGLNGNVVQTNMSYNKRKGTVRGMHFQHSPYAETKLIRCTKGAIYDVIIDLRKYSPTYKQWIGIELTEQNRKMLYVPENFAHGFITLEDHTEVAYQVTQYYTPGAEGGIRWNDRAFNIKWPLAIELISEKDKTHPDFSE